MDEEVEYFIKSLKEAGKKMDSHYFQLPIAGSEDLIYRERVYCYELYHQLRNTLTDRFRYKLDGEVDKRGHPVIRKVSIPDFIVHDPGRMDGNLIVIEVKPVTVKDSLNELTKDLDKLYYFMTDARYKWGISLIYGNGKDAFPNKIQITIKEFIDQHEELRNRLILIWHPSPGERPLPKSIV